MALAAALLLLLLASPAAFAANYIVGDGSGWSQGVDYGTSTQGKTFNVGDTLSGGEVIKVGINGFGIIGQQIAIILLALQYNNNVELVAINDPFIPIESMAVVFNSISYRLQVRRHDFEVKDENTLLFGERSVAVHAIRNPEEIPWAEMGVEYVIESTGLFTEMDKAAAHLKGGAKKVIITDISKDAPMFVVGVNEKEYKPGYDIVSCASCITNYLAPILEVIYDRFGILEGHMKIFDSAIATQYIDGPSRMHSMDGGPAFFNPIPIVITGAKAVEKIGKILQVFNGGVGIGGVLTPTVITISATSDAANAIAEFLQTIGDSLGIDDGPLNKLIKLLKLLSIPAAKKTNCGPCTAASTEIIPSSAADVEAVKKVLPYLSDKLNGTVSRVPTMVGSIVYLTVRLEVEATLEAIRAAIKEESEGKFKGILGYIEGVDVSRDFLGDSTSSIFYSTAVVALNENQVSLIFYCDNEWGYGSRVIDLIVHMASEQAYSLEAIKRLFMLIT